MGSKYQIRLKTNEPVIGNRCYEDLYIQSFLKYMKIRIFQKKNIIFWTVRP